MSLSLRDALRRVPRGLLGMIALVAACESFIVRDALKFSRIEADDWREAGHAADGELPKGGLLFFGDSQLKYGVSPLAIESKLGQPSHCLAVQSGQAPTSYFLLRRALASGVIPSAVVVDFEPHLMRDGIEHNQRMWPELLTFRETAELTWAARDPLAFASINLGRLFPSYRARFEVRENLKAALRGETTGIASWLEMGVRNRGMNRGALLMAKSGNPHHDVTRWGNPTETPWTPAPINDHYARKFIKLARSRNIPVYCALMPVDPGLQEKYETNGMDRPYFAWLRALQDDYHNLYVLDWRHSGYDSRVMNDAMHLDHDGAAGITLALGEYLQKSYGGQGIDVRWVRMPGFRLDGARVAAEDSSRSHAFMMSTAKLRR